MVTLTLDLHLPSWLHTEGDAEFSPDRSYRYWLTRRWGPGPALMFVSLNPSDVDEHRDDQTTRRDWPSPTGSATTRSRCSTSARP